MRSRSSSRHKTGRGRTVISWLILGGTAVLVALVFTLRAPKVARQVWHHIGARKVEGYAELIQKAAQESGVDPCLIAAVMYAESRGRIDAVSSADALGLLQLKETSAGDAAKRLRLATPTREALLSDAELNIRLGANHLAWLIRADGPDVERVLVAYNAGRTKVQRWVRQEGSYEAWRARRLAANDSGALRYALDVLEFRDGFRERGVIDPSSASSKAKSPMLNTVIAADAANPPVVPVEALVTGELDTPDGARIESGSAPAVELDVAPPNGPPSERPTDVGSSVGSTAPPR